MDKHLIAAIQSRYESKSTEELLAIWQAQNHQEYSSAAFEAVRRLLVARGAKDPSLSADVSGHSDSDLPTSVSVIVFLLIIVMIQRVVSILVVMANGVPAGSMAIPVNVTLLFLYGSLIKGMLNLGEGVCYGTNDSALNRYARQRVVDAGKGYWFGAVAIAAIYTVIHAFGLMKLADGFGLFGMMGVLCGKIPDGIDPAIQTVMIVSMISLVLHVGILLACLTRSARGACGVDDTGNGPVFGSLFGFLVVVGLVWFFTSGEGGDAGDGESGKTAGVDLGNGIVVEMAWIPPGTFMMGIPKKNPLATDMRSRMTVTNGFWIGKHEVTQAEWKAVMGETPSHFTVAGMNAPVENVSWEDCQIFIQRLNKGTPQGEFRLPTHVEWEYACRAGTETDLNSGQNVELMIGLSEYPSVSEVAWYAGNSGKTTHPVGRKKPNAWGLYDMHGNVSEWCQDKRGNKQDESEDAAFVICGGNWATPAISCHSARFGHLSGEGRSSQIGFRLVQAR